MKAFKNFILKELLLTIIIALVAFILFQSVLKEFYSPVFWTLLIIISVLTGGLHYSILQVAEKETSKFTSRFLMATGIKMIIYLIFIIVYVFSHTTNAKIFLIYFLIHYLLYTAFEVYMILRYLKQQDK